MNIDSITTGIVIDHISAGRGMRLYELLGDIIYRVEVAELEGETLAPYMVKSVVLELTGKEKEEYECHRAVYRDFAVRNRIDFGKDSGWRDFLIAVSRRPDGRRAFFVVKTERKDGQSVLRAGRDGVA